MAVLRTGDATAQFGVGVVRHRVASGVWQRPCRGVVVTHNGGLSPAEALTVALASAPPGSALAGPTALALDGFTGFADDRIHIVIPRGGRHPSQPDLIVHVSRELSDADVHPQRSPRRTRPARSIIDLASWQTSQRRARTVVIAAFQQGLLNVRQVREALTRRGPCRHRALIVESILDASGGVQSLPERDFATIWAATGLPRPTHQRRLRRQDRHFYLDVYCESLGFGVEVHGVHHLGVSQWDADLTRANEIVIAGIPVLQFTSFAVQHEPRRVADQLLAMAASRGWVGTNRPALTLLGRRKRRTVRA